MILRNEPVLAIFVKTVSWRARGRIERLEEGIFLGETNMITICIQLDRKKRPKPKRLRIEFVTAIKNLKC